jgi:hypothetical protein
MSLQDFQKAVCDLVASPDLCRVLLRDPQLVLRRYELSQLECRRLVDMVQQRGMSVNCTLYRFNRITPLYTLMPLTSFVLGDRFMPEVERFWESFRETGLRFKQEIDRFGDFLCTRLSKGEIDNPLLGETVEFELATNDLRFSQRHRILQDLGPCTDVATASRALRLHPMVKVVSFQHDPSELLRQLKERRLLLDRLVTGEYWLVIDLLQEELQVRKVDPSLGRLLKAIESQSIFSIPNDSVEVLREAGLVVSKTEPRPS